MPRNIPVYNVPASRKLDAAKYTDDVGGPDFRAFDCTAS